MRRSLSFIFIPAIILMAAGCAGTKITEMVHAPWSGSLIQSIAIDPRGGIMGDEIAMHLNSGSLRVLDSDQTTQLARRIGRSISA